MNYNSWIAKQKIWKLSYILLSDIFTAVQKYNNTKEKYVNNIATGKTELFYAKITLAQF